MSAKKPKPGWTEPGWTEPGAVNGTVNGTQDGAVDRVTRRAARKAEAGHGAVEPAEARKGTAAADPVLSLAPKPAAGTRRDSASAGEHAPDNRSPAEIEADIEQTRDRLAGTLDELSERLSPRAALRKANSSVRGAFVTPDGSVRKDRAAIALGALVSVLGGAVAVRTLRRK